MNRKSEFLLGDRMCMRLIKIKDASDILHCLNTASEVPSNLNFFSGGIPTLAKEVGWIRSTIRRMRDEEELVFSIFSRDRKQFIGTVGLLEIDWQNKNARVGITILNEEFRGHGYAHEILDLTHGYGFEILGLNKIFMSFYFENMKMHRIADRLGYRKAGVLKEEYFLKGKWLDFVRYELTAKEYQKRIQGAQ
ncbi:MAG: hypothetical protein A2931_03040 [Candidatus Niyogibacteria bacterium RIFCSPLOWO2_01_FULL_45_48]|uniref:N-acetyltransferase domain-containing protein n=2 Tax=Candidatus Niyogiibacteriota TaxID=1817912 RepID=A0A1G2EXN6_9BACT|nr:MAG: hypothetical protein A2835_01985 [Candidatus Niyogibacteria bacterium RIFCSPHIGHO2_01_FULL_45_28]OGZ30111.1 MAG: hypothetical protein A3J00_03680 [Candidatus Niyogibacteria bacterium RIFCSPLOWO2_02_FULL_45_13]OGZ30142.1 MAG: hypothetical protein A2931_03040 [Candidatus Niyogibacteria bacterium RIFCSPLOWO2_01_FULL_45_48]